MDNNTLYNKTMGDFRTSHGLPIATIPYDKQQPHERLGRGAIAMHYGFFNEEYHEYMLALAKRGMDVHDDPLDAPDPLELTVECADAFVDMNYFAGGAMLHAGMPIDIDEILGTREIIENAQGALTVLHEAKEEFLGEGVREMYHDVFRLIFAVSIKKALWVVSRYNGKVDEYLGAIDFGDGEVLWPTDRGVEVFMGMYMIVHNSNMSKISNSRLEAENQCDKYNERFKQEWLTGETGLLDAKVAKVEPVEVDGVTKYAIYCNSKLLKGSGFFAPEEALATYIRNL
jgi:hypothetical protein